MSEKLADDGPLFEPAVLRDRVVVSAEHHARVQERAERSAFLR